MSLYLDLYLLKENPVKTLNGDLAGHGGGHLDSGTRVKTLRYS